MTKSMTEGNPLKLILTFALPLLLGNLLQQLYNIVDGIVVGKFVGENALAGVGCTASVQFFVLGFCTGLCTGFGIPIAKMFGAGCYDKMRKYVYNSAIITVAVSLIMTVVCAVFCNPILHALKVPVGEIYDNAYVYLLIIFLGIPFTMFYNLVAGMLRSVGDSRTPFYVLVISMFLNIGLDLFLVVSLNMGCAGAAIATISSQAFSGIACTFVIIKKIPVLHCKAEERKINKSMIGDLFAMGIPMGLQFSITAIGSMVMQATNNSLEVDAYISGFAAGAKIKQFAMCPFDAFGTAVSVYCSQNLGVRDVPRIKKGFRLGLLIAVTYGIVVGLVLIFFGKYLSLLFLNAKESVEAIEASALYLRRMGYFYWVLAILMITRMGSQGLGYSGRVVFSGVTEMLARIFTCLFFAKFLGYGYDAICFADQSAWCSATLYLIPTWIYCIRKVSKKIEKEKNQTEIKINV